MLRTLRAIERCDVALLLIDATEGITAQDTHIAGMVVEAKKGIILVVNKWDAVVKDLHTYYEFEDRVREAFKFVDYAPIVFVSALTGQRVSHLLDYAREVYAQRQKRVPTSELNNFLREAVLQQPPMAVKKGAHLRLYYAVQPQTEPPVFLFSPMMVNWCIGRMPVTLKTGCANVMGFKGRRLSLSFVRVNGKRTTNHTRGALSQGSVQEAVGGRLARCLPLLWRL